MSTISPKVMRFARQQQRKTRERMERERHENARVEPELDAVPVFDRGNDPLLFVSNPYSDDSSDWS